jgi:signal transduction histidine kinase
MTGEYEERLKQQELTLVVKQPEEHLRIMADSRQLWRVFDNLMNNICKYAQGGTRVYLTLERADDKAVFSLKNTSRYALDISSDELMERFVRGDRSRNTEGSGLGLSIAQSLTQLQKGSFSLVIDGDLFKVVLEFPVV